MKHKILKVIDQRITDKIIFSMCEDNIFCTECPPNTILSIEDCLSSTKITNEMQRGVALPLLCDISNVVKMSKACREHFAGAIHAETFTRAALIVTNPISKIIGNFFLGLNKPIKKTQLFNNKEKALEWLKGVQ